LDDAAHMTGKKLAEIAVNTVLGLLATLAVLFGTGAWSAKEDVADHQHDVQAIVELQVRTLDVLCDTPNNRAKRACVDPRPALAPPKK
jgi:hypothetical protein